jgi:hypothetical protein
MNKKKLRDEVELVRRAIIMAIPTGVSFAAIIIALAQLIERYQEQALEEEGTEGKDY